MEALRTVHNNRSRIAAGVIALAAVGVTLGFVEQNSHNSNTCSEGNLQFQRPTNTLVLKNTGLEALVAENPAAVDLIFLMRDKNMLKQLKLPEHQYVSVHAYVDNINLVGSANNRALTVQRNIIAINPHFIENGAADANFDFDVLHLENNAPFKSSVPYQKLDPVRMVIETGAASCRGLR